MIDGGAKIGHAPAMLTHNHVLMVSAFFLSSGLPGFADTVTVENGTDALDVNGPSRVVWQRIIPEVERIRQLEDRHDQLPRFAIFRTDQGDNREEINELLDEAVEILGLSQAAETRTSISGLEALNRKDEESISRLREKRIAAPTEALVTDTVADLEAKIEKLEKEVTQREGVIDDLKESFGDELRSIGLNVSREQLDFLLSTVVGDNVIEISIAFHNVKMITDQLERLTGESLENIQLARRYYGMYTVLLDTLLYAYDEALTEIDEGYLPEIETIRSRTKALMKKTEKLLDGAASTHRGALQVNLESQAFTMKAADLYRDYLEEQRQGLRDARKRLERDAELAMNTYETVQLSGDLLTVMHSSEELFNLLFDLQVPDLRPFENLELRREFEKMTTKLRHEG